MSNLPATQTPAALAISQPESLDVLTEILGSDSFDASNLTRISVPREGETWRIDSADGTENRKVLRGVILKSVGSRAYWSKPFGSGGMNNQPECSSSGALRSGVGTPGGDCASCPHNQFGSAAGGQGKACRERRTLVILLEGEVLPSILNLPPSSIQTYKNYQLSLAKSVTKLQHVVTELTLKREFARGGNVYIQVECNSGGKLEEADRKAVDSYIQTLEATFDTIARNDTMTRDTPAPAASAAPVDALRTMDDCPF